MIRIVMIKIIAVTGFSNGNSNIVYGDEDMIMITIKIE